MRSRFKSLSEHPLFFPIAVTVIYFAVNLILVLNHEAWRDEANPWQIAKALGLDNIYETLQVEPHPMLWFLILTPFAKLGLPYITTNIISLLIMSLSVFLLTRYAPFSKKTKIVIILSAAFFYFNPVISRNYCLVALGIVATAMAYKSRLQHPIRYALALALLCQSHFLALPMAAVLAITFMVEYFKSFGRKHVHKIIISLGIIGASVLASTPIILGNLGGHTLIVHTAIYAGVDWLTELNVSLFGAGVPIFEFAFISAAIYFYFRYPKQLIFLIISVGAWFATLIFVYKFNWLPIQKSSLILLFLIFSFWTISYDKPRRPAKLYKKLRKFEFFNAMKRVPVIAVLVVPLALTIPNTIAAAIHDLTGDYGYSAQFTNYVNRNTPENSVIMVADSVSAGLAITFVPLLEGNRHIYDVNTGSFMDFYKYGGYPKLDEKDFAAAISELSSVDLYYLIPASTCAAQFLPEESWELVETFEGHPETIESPIELYHVSSPVADLNEDKQEIDDIFAVNSVPRMDISFDGTLDTDYGVWNDRVGFKITDKYVYDNNIGGLTGRIKTRGNTTFAAGEKYGAFQYKVRLNQGTDFFGFGEHKEWVLLANFLDRSYLRQFFLSGAGRLIMGDGYFVPQMKYVELYINDEYEGLYLLAESVEEDKNRLEIEAGLTALQAEVPFLVQMENGRIARAGMNLYDGTYFMIDDPAKPCFNYNWLNGAAFTGTMITFEYPESLNDMTGPQAEYIKNTVENLYRKARNHAPFEELGIDAVSFANYFAFQELMFNTGFGSSSVYFHKPLGGKITAGPLWDFDQLLMMDIGSGFTRPSSCDNNLYRYLLGYPEFRSLMTERLVWINETLNPKLERQLDELQANPILRAAAERNEAKYKTWGKKIDIGVFYQNPQVVSYKSWDEHVEHIRKSLFTGYEVDGRPASRAAWILAHFDELK
jgi:hypothetical protein